MRRLILAQRKPTPPRIKSCWDGCYIVGDSEHIKKANDTIKKLIHQVQGCGWPAISAKAKLQHLSTLTNDAKVWLAFSNFGKKEGK